jgi:hypothetical protein
METEVNRRGLPKVLSLVDIKIVYLLIFPVRRSRYKQQHNTEPALWSDFIWRSLGLTTESSSAFQQQKSEGAESYRQLAGRSMPAKDITCSIVFTE